MAPLGTRVIVHEKPENRTSWGHNGTPGWYIHLYLDHYRCMQCYMTATGIVRINDTLQYTPREFSLSKTTTEEYLQQDIGDIIAIEKNPPKTIPLLSYGNATENMINQIAQILHISASKPRFKILPLPSLLTQTQNENFQDQNISRIPVAAPRVEPVSQPLRGKLLHLAPTTPPRLQPYTPPILDTDPNPWIKKFTKYLKSPQIPKAKKTQASPRQSKHRLRRSSRNFRQNFRTQAAQHLFAKHLFNLPHDFHIYNKQ